jgi:hypothetical protein
MSILLRTLKGVQSTLDCIREVSSCGLQFLWAVLQLKARLAARLLAVEKQIAAYLAMNLRPSVLLPRRSWCASAVRVVLSERVGRGSGWDWRKTDRNNPILHNELQPRLAGIAAAASPPGSTI